MARVPVVLKDPPTEAKKEGIALAPRDPWPESFNLPYLDKGAAAKAKAADAAEAADGTLDEEPPVEDDRGQSAVPTGAEPAEAGAP